MELTQYAVIYQSKTDSYRLDSNIKRRYGTGTVNLGVLSTSVSPKLEMSHDELIEFLDAQKGAIEKHVQNNSEFIRFLKDGGTEREAFSKGLRLEPITLEEEVEYQSIRELLDLMLNDEPQLLD